MSNIREKGSGDTKGRLLELTVITDILNPSTSEADIGGSL